MSPIKRARLAAGLSVRAAARLLGASPSSIWRWENAGAPERLSFQVLSALAGVYGTTVEALLGESKRGGP